MAVFNIIQVQWLYFKHKTQLLWNKIWYAIALIRFVIEDICWSATLVIFLSRCLIKQCDVLFSAHWICTYVRPKTLNDGIWAWIEYWPNILLIIVLGNNIDKTSNIFVSCFIACADTIQLYFFADSLHVIL